MLHATGFVNVPSLHPWFTTGTCPHRRKTSDRWPRWRWAWRAL